MDRFQYRYSIPKLIIFPQGKERDGGKAGKDEREASMSHFKSHINVQYDPRKSVF